MTSIQIVEHLGYEFSISPEQVRSTLEMLDAGLRAPVIARVRRERTGGLPEYAIRRLLQRREELTELDRRRGTILRALESDSAPVKPDEPTLERIRRSMDRFELEDLFLPHRRPWPTNSSRRCPRSNAPNALRSPNRTLSTSPITAPTQARPSRATARRPT